MSRGRHEDERAVLAPERAGEPRSRARAEQDLARAAAVPRPAERRRGAREDGRHRAASPREAVERAKDPREIGRREVLEPRIVGPQDARPARGDKHLGRDGGELRGGDEVVVTLDEGHQGSHPGRRVADKTVGMIRTSSGKVRFLALVLAATACGSTPAVPSNVALPAASPCPSPPVGSIATATVAPPPPAEPTDFAAIASAQGAANAKPGMRHVPARDIPVPTDDVSPEAQAMIGRPYTSNFNQHPRDAAEWKAFVAKAAETAAPKVTALAAKLHVTVTPTTIAGVPCFVLAPDVLPARNKNRLLVFVHGGAYVLGPGVSGTKEGVLLAAFGGFKVLAVDYRMAPDFPYPAAMDDAMAVWKKAVTMANPKNMAIFGSSTGGAMTLAMVLRAKDEHLPLPAAMAPGTPWADLTDAGDSYKTNEWLDDNLVTARGLLADAARLYATGHDLKDPQLSPIYGDFHGLPPAILTTGTRDLFLSNTVRTHRKLRRAGVEADLDVYEGLSHGQYASDPDAPETKESMTDIASFFDRHLGR